MSMTAVVSVWNKCLKNGEQQQQKQQQQQQKQQFKKLEVRCSRLKK